MSKLKRPGPSDECAYRRARIRRTPSAMADHPRHAHARWTRPALLRFVPLHILPATPTDIDRTASPP